MKKYVFTLFLLIFLGFILNINKVLAISNKKVSSPVSVSTKYADSYIQNIVENSCNNIFNKIISKNKIDYLAKLSEQFSFNEDKKGMQIYYIPGAVSVDNGTFFSVKNLSSSDFMSDNATLKQDLNVEGNSSLYSTKIQKLELGSSEQPIGITFYDKVTNQAVCISSEDLILKVVSGSCS